MNTVSRSTNFTFKNGLKSKNRVMVPPMASSTASTSGMATERTLDHYSRLTESGAGILFVEYTYIHPTGRGEENQLGIFSDTHIEGLKKLADLIKKSGALAGIQLVHNGAKSATELTGEPLLGPSPISVPAKGQQLEIPREISLDEIHEYQTWHLDAAERAIQAGFQMVEFHAAHGYGLNQWLSPITNHRIDSYGGSLEGRSRMMREICEQVRRKFPQILLGVRIPGSDSYPGGLSPDEMILVSQDLEKLGVDFLDVSSGIGGWRRPSDRTGEGYLFPEAANIKAHVGLPVIGVGGIKTGPFIDQALRENLITFAAVGRTILEDPKKFYDDVLNKESKKIGNICTTNYKIAH